MRARPMLRSTVLVTGLLLAACGGDGGGSSTATSTASSVPDTRQAVTTTTVPVTTTPPTAPPTTLPPTLDLDALPGLVAVIASSCAPEPYPPHDIIEKPIVCTLKPNGTETQVVSQPGEDPNGLAFTRDGTHLWYGDPYTKFGYIIDLTTGEHRQRVRNEPLRSGISPDGQYFLFIDNYTYVFAISRPDGSPLPDGSTSQVVSSDTHVSLYGGPSWAPDSIRFAYLSTDDGLGGDLECAEVWVGAIDGRPPVKLTDFANSPDGAVGCPESVRWSPTDERILIHMLGKPMFIIENLYTINADGTDLTALTHGEPAADPNASTYAIVGSSYAGDWSPDGKYIVFVIGDGTEYQLAVMNSDGTQVTPIAAAPLGIASSLVTIRWRLG